MSPRIAGATAARVLRQLSHDRRTVAMLLVVPVVLMALLRWLYDAQPGTFDRVGPALVGIFPLVVLFLVTSITMLRERTSGTLERLMTLPLAKLDLLAGYGLAFALVGAVQAGVTAGVSLAFLGLDVAGSAWLLVGVAVANALLGMALGLLVSAFAASEFQAVQFMPAVVLPQILLCGLFIPRERMAGGLEAISDALPMSYAVDALQAVAAGADTPVAEILVVLGAALAALALGALTLRRRTS